MIYHIWMIHTVYIASIFFKQYSLRYHPTPWNPSDSVTPSRFQVPILRCDGNGCALHSCPVRIAVHVHPQRGDSTGKNADFHGAHGDFNWEISDFNGGISDLIGKLVILPQKNGDFMKENSDLTWEGGHFTAENCDFIAHSMEFQWD